MKRKSAWGGDFAEQNALAFGQEGTAEARLHHIEKRKRKARGVEIVFDPQAHREYLTGFHKRKVERRNKAKRQIAEKEKKQRLEDRAEKRAKLREELDLQRYETPPASSDEDQSEGEDIGAIGRGVRVYKANDIVTTVTTTSVLLNSDEEDEGPSEGTSEGDSEAAEGDVRKPEAVVAVSSKGSKRTQKKLPHKERAKRKSKRRRKAA